MKNKLGKVTLVSLCVFLTIYLLEYIVGLFALIRAYVDVGDLNLVIEYLFFDKHSSIINIVQILDNWLLGPMICLGITFVYTLLIVKNTKIKRFIYAVTALAIFYEILIYVFDWEIVTNLGNAIVYFLVLLIKIAFLISFTLLFMDYNKQKIKKIIYILFGSTYICAAIYFIISGLIFLFSRVLSQYQYIGDMISVSDVILWIWWGVIWPIFELAVGGLVLGYILFPEKYIKTEN